jgi:hypothetical protein
VEDIGVEEIVEIDVGKGVGGIVIGLVFFAECLQVVYVCINIIHTHEWVYKVNMMQSTKESGAKARI